VTRRTRTSIAYILAISLALVTLVPFLPLAVLTARDGDGAARWLGEEDFDLVLSDVRMPGLDGMALQRRAMADRLPQPAILMRAFGSAETAVDALRNGVFSILTYPVTDGQLVNEITRACARKRHGEARLKATERRTS
jgi:DNA-binding NtrC family response regulator